MKLLAGPTQTSDAYKISSSLSRIMAEYSRVVENYFPEIDDNISQLRTSVSSLIIWTDTTTEDLDELESFRDTIGELFDAVNMARSGIEEFRGAFQKIRDLRVSRSMNRATSRLLRVMNSLDDRFHDLQEFCLDTIDLIEERIS